MDVLPEVADGVLVNICHSEASEVGAEGNFVQVLLNFRSFPILPNLGFLESYGISIFNYYPMKSEEHEDWSTLLSSPTVLMVILVHCILRVTQCQNASSYASRQSM